MANPYVEVVDSATMGNPYVEGFGKASMPHRYVNNNLQQYRQLQIGNKHGSLIFPHQFSFFIGSTTWGRQATVFYCLFGERAKMAICGL